jgi:hypothetical protein
MNLGSFGVCYAGHTVTDVEGSKPKYHPRYLSHKMAKVEDVIDDIWILLNNIGKRF